MAPLLPPGSWALSSATGEVTKERAFFRFALPVEAVILSGRRLPRAETERRLVRLICWSKSLQTWEGTSCGPSFRWMAIPLRVLFLDPLPERRMAVGGRSVVEARGETDAVY